MLGSNTRSQAASRPSPDRSALRSWGGLVRILHWFTAKRTGSDPQIISGGVAGLVGYFWHRAEDPK